MSDIEGVESELYSLPMSGQKAGFAAGRENVTDSYTGFALTYLMRLPHTNLTATIELMWQFS